MINNTKQKSKINLAFGSIPKDGGTFTFYKNIRPALKKFGIKIYCVAIGKEQAQLWENRYADDHTVLLAPNTHNVKTQAKIFVNWCVEHDINMVMGINSEAILSAIPHLPQSIRVVSRCANGFDHGYKITLIGEDRLQAIIALTPKLKMDLIQDYNAKPDLIHLIPNGIHPKPFEVSYKERKPEKNVIRLGFLGRLEHNQKGVLHLPPLLEALDKKGVNFSMKIAGKGKHRAQLEQELKMFIDRGQVKLLGALYPEEIPNFFKDIDLYIFPSHFEGCPNALLEAMMAGCVSLAWQIYGITDYVLHDGKTGYLHEFGDYKSMAENIFKLHNDRALLATMVQHTVSEAKERFTPEKTAKAYASILLNLMEKPLPNIMVKPWNKFEINQNFKQLGDPWIPRKLKFFIKKILNN